MLLLVIATLISSSVIKVCLPMRRIRFCRVKALAWSCWRHMAHAVMRINMSVQAIRLTLRRCRSRSMTEMMILGKLGMYIIISRVSVPWCSQIIGWAIIVCW